MTVFDAVNMIRWKTEWGHLKAMSLTRDRRTVYEKQRQALVTAISERNTEKSESTMRKHLETVRHDLFGARPVIN